MARPDDAAAFLAAEERHDPTEFDGIESIAGRLLDAVRSNTGITIYGDFDVDGVCATTILVELLRGLGGNCDWFIPDRISDGYGLNREALDALAERGSELVVTVDCGVASVGEVDHANGLGLEMIVTDHHQLGPSLPSCPVLHPVASNYPFPDLCGAAVAWKLAEQVRRVAGLPPGAGEGDLDLVALATVADVMPLVGENRHLVKSGLTVARRAARQGMRALLAESGVEPMRLEAEDFGFRLGPRINAAGRMYRADAGVELFLTDSPERAGEISSELSRANAERKRVEREVESAAKKAFRELDEPDPAAVVVAGPDWHPGVVGIVASRLARSHGLPAVVISTENGMGRGSARGVPGVDLYRALKVCDEVLETYGGHPAAAGLSLKTDRIPEFRSLLREAIIEQAGGVPEAAPERVDSCIGGRVIGLELAEELDRLRPFGNGNPSPRYLIPSARIEGLTEMGEGRHCRFTVKSGDGRAGGVAFGRTGFGIEADEPVDLVAELSINHWNGTMTPRLEVIDAVPPPTEFELLATAGEEEWWTRFEVSMSGEGEIDQSISPESGGSREPVRHEGAATAVMAEQVSSGESVLILVSEAWRRWRDLRGAPGIDRFSPSGVTDVRGLWAGSPESERSPFMDVGAGSIRLTDYESLPPDADWVSEFENVVLFDPPPRPESLDLASSGGGLLHYVADRESLAYALGAAEARDPRPFLRPIFRAVRDGGELTGEELKRMLDSDGVAPLAPERAAALVTVLLEAGIIRSTGTGTGRTLGSVSSEEIDLERSDEYRRLIALQQEETLFLKRSDS